MGICNSVKKPNTVTTTTERVREQEPAAIVKRNKISAKSIYDGNKN